MKLLITLLAGFTLLTGCSTPPFGPSSVMPVRIRSIGVASNSDAAIAPAQRVLGNKGYTTFSLGTSDDVRSTATTDAAMLRNADAILHIDIHDVFTNTYQTSAYGSSVYYNATASGVLTDAESGRTLWIGDTNTRLPFLVLLLKLPFDLLFQPPLNNGSRYGAIETAATQIAERVPARAY